MRFSRLRLNGFKSFVDPTDLIISDGLTGVVGPNGCGKSNLLEALRWVMGENRAKAMRGGGMEDVIFAGAASRPARNFAEVSLMVDNSERLAPAGFNDQDQLEITRRITRDAGSAYKANGKDVRARDVQMLFADASTGAHSPALVRQGQISELINARPKARRRILEEAAGISGLYQRRHEAELKLNGAEANLARVDDVIEQLATQLAQLERQAKQAARYREIGISLRHAEGVLLYRRWREADDLRLVAATSLRERMSLAVAAEAQAREAAKLRAQQDAALPPLREEEAIAAAVVQRLHVEKERLEAEFVQAESTIEMLSERITQLDQDMQRELTLNADAEETIARLSAESARHMQSAQGHEDRLKAAAQVAAEASEILQVRETELSQQTEDAARLAARHHSAHRLFEEASKTVSRFDAETTQARNAVARSELEAAQSESAFFSAQQGMSLATEQANAAEAHLTDIEAQRAEVQTREANARSARAEAEGELTTLRAEATALARLVDRDTAESGQVLDLLVVTPGYEQALGAALADDLRAGPVEADEITGWVDLPAYTDVPPLPDQVVPLSNFVRAPQVLARRMSQVGLVSPELGARLQAQLGPGQRLVSQDGDMWRWDGYRIGADDTPSATALRLKQLNRLEELKQALERAQSNAEGCVQAHEHLVKELAALTQADRAAREARRAADRGMADAARALSRADGERSIAAGRVETLALSVDRFQAETLSAQSRLDEAKRGLEDLGDLEAARGLLDDVKLTVEAARLTMLSKRTAHDELKREGEARRKRIGAIDKEMSNWRHRLETAETRIAELEQRKVASEQELELARALPDQIVARQRDLGTGLRDGQARLNAAKDALSQGETLLRAAIQTERDAEKNASEGRELRARAEAVSEAADETASLARARIVDELDQEPLELLEALDVDPDALPNADRIEADVNRFKRQRDALGAVNLRAEEDARTVREELKTLESEKVDLEHAIAKLRTGIAALNKEGRERLLTAFEQVNSNFSVLFTHLFGGGAAKLVMVESDDPLEAGLEIMCHPPGKKLSTLSLLSGGEQTLTALALIFAVFLANPAPICVLDEVDAPLDDANVTRFCDLLDEMTRRTDTRFLIITHHAITMARMDRLFGVTMAELGVSQLVSVDLKNAEALVA